MYTSTLHKSSIILRIFVGSHHQLEHPKTKTLQVTRLQLWKTQSKWGSALRRMGEITCCHKPSHHPKVTRK